MAQSHRISCLVVTNYARSSIDPSAGEWSTCTAGLNTPQINRSSPQKRCHCDRGSNLRRSARQLGNGSNRVRRPSPPLGIVERRSVMLTSTGHRSKITFIFEMSVRAGHLPVLVGIAYPTRNGRTDESRASSRARQQLDLELEPQSCESESKHRASLNPHAVAPEQTIRNHQSSGL